MLRDRTFVVTATALSLAVLSATVAMATPRASTAPVGHKVTVSSRPHISAGQTLRPLAAGFVSPTDKARVAVFSRHNGGPSLDQHYELIAVKADGKTIDLGPEPRGTTGFSMSGYVLTVGVVGESGEVDSLDEWIVGNGRRSSPMRLSLPQGDAYVSSAPDGAVLRNYSSGELLRMDVRGDITPLAEPFPQKQDIIGGVAGPTGVVVWTLEGHIAFVRFASGKVTRLDSSLIANDDILNVPICYSVSTTAVACANEYDDDYRDTHDTNLFLDPLDGSAAYTSTTHCPGPAAMIGRAAVFNTIPYYDPNYDGCPQHLDLLASNGKVRIVRKATTLFAPVSGLDGAVTTTSSDKDAAPGATGLLVSHPAHVSTLLKRKDSLAESSTFSLHDGHVAWEQDSGPAADRIAVKRRTLIRNNGHSGVSLGKTHNLDGAPAASQQIAQSGRSTAFIAAVGHHFVLRVKTPKRIITVSEHSLNGPLSFADHRLLVETADNAGPTQVFNLQTRRRTTLASVGTISSHYLDYLDRSGRLYQKDLDTGVKRTVTTGLSFGGGVLAHGPWVGWNPNNGSDRSAYEDPAKDSAPIFIPSGFEMWSLTDAGAIIDPPADHVVLTDETIPYQPNEAFSLLPYGSSVTQPLLTGHYLIAGPQISDHVLAYIDDHGRLKAQALS